MRLFEITSALSYRGEHSAPDNTDAPIYDLTANGIYPPDIYTHPNNYINHNDQYDSIAYSIVKSTYKKPNAKIIVYRAVPYTKSSTEKLNDLYDMKKQYLRRGRVPSAWDGNKNTFYDDISTAIEQLETLPPSEKEQPSINNGDWVTIIREYAVEHAHAMHWKSFKIISKTVLAKHLFTDGNSLAEWGFVKN